jgi:hypothetical protein
MVVKFGGFGNDVLDETWELDLRQRTWLRRYPAHSPSARSGSSMVYDEARGVSVLFGGYHESDDSFVNDTWLWDGVDWTEAAPATRPQAREYHVLAYDSLRDVVVLFGGMGLYPPGTFNDLWEWNGVNWSERPATIRPPGRAAMAFVYDSQRDALVMFGGGISIPLPTDTWEWQNDAWVQRFPTTYPPGRTWPAAGYSPVGGYTLLFGGQGSNLSIRDDTWLWDGTTWMPTAPNRHPSARNTGAAAYVPPLRSIVIHGGLLWDQHTELNDTWAFVHLPGALELDVTGWPLLDLP